MIRRRKSDSSDHSESPVMEEGNEVNEVNEVSPKPKTAISGMLGRWPWLGSSAGQ